MDAIHEKMDRTSFGEPITQLVGQERGWQTRAAVALGMKRPTLARYLKWEEQGEVARIPATAWAALERLERNAKPIEEPRYEELITSFARGLVAVQEDLDSQGYIRAPYPEDLQRGLNTAAAIKAMRGPHSAQLPVNIAELLAAASEPLFRWAPMAASDRLEPFLSARLMEGTQITQECLDLAELEEEDAEREFFVFLMDKCAALDGSRGQTLYEAWRRAVIEVPVAESHSVIMRRPVLSSNVSLTLELIQFFYTSVSSTHAIDGHVPICPVTKTRMRLVGERWVSESRDAGVRRECDAQGPERLPWTPQMIELKRPPRMFWTHPGRYELDVEKLACDRGWRVECWPSFDAVDLVISRPGGAGRRYAVDVKDYVSPSRLARWFSGFKGFRQHTRLVVVPDHVVELHPGYLDMFKRIRAESGANDVSIETISAFVRRLEE